MFRATMVWADPATSQSAQTTTINGAARRSFGTRSNNLDGNCGPPMQSLPKWA
jgi:hypothetical protein